MFLTRARLPFLVVIAALSAAAAWAELLAPSDHGPARDGDDSCPAVREVHCVPSMTHYEGRAADSIVELFGGVPMMPMSWWRAMDSVKALELGRSGP